MKSAKYIINSFQKSFVKFTSANLFYNYTPLIMPHKLKAA